MTTSTADDLTRRITQLIEDALFVEAPSPEADLIASGLLDSLALVTLITEIEQEFGIELPLDDFEVDGFRSVEQIAAVVVERQAA